MYGNKERSIERAFLQIYKTKEIDAITVKEICQMAGISRATFYTYYTNVKCLLDEIEDRLIADISDILKSWKYLNLKNLDTTRPLPMYLDVYDYVYEKKEVYQALFGPYGSQKFILRYNEISNRDYLEKILMDGIETTNANMLSAFCAGSIIYSSNVWIKNTDKSTPGEMAIMATKTVFSILYKRT